MDKLINDVNQTYAVIVNPDVVTPTFMRVFFAFCSNNSVDDRMYAKVNTVLQENGFGTLQGNGESNMKAAILYMNIVAQEKGYGLDDLDELLYSYFAIGRNNPKLGGEMRDMFLWFYYPWMSKDAP